ncbi:MULTISPECIES: restriction endonuclease subunit S [Streptomyces]|uniref:restriction endonuclease subunit S n=1 Tax=Streptomyces TaxID=1883 RepID=UPI00131E2DA5
MSRENWESRPLGDLASFASGKTPPRSRQAEYFDAGEIPWVKTMDLNNGRISRTSECITSRAVSDTKIRIHRPGTVLIAMYGGFSQIGRTGILCAPAATNQAITAIFPDPDSLDSRYLLHFLNYKVDYWRTVASSSRKDPNITKSDVMGFPVDLPSLNEQKEISEALDDAEERIFSLRQLIAKKQAVKQGIVQQLLSGNMRLPGFAESWASVSLGELGIFLKGRGVRRDDVRPSGIPCIRYGELYTEFANYTAVTRSFVSHEVAATALPIYSGDLLFAGSGETRDEIGMCVAYVGEQEAVAGGDIVVLRGSGFNPVYLATLANSPAVTQQKARAGQGDAVVHISSRALAEITVKIPERVEQDAVAEVLIDADRELGALHRRLGKAHEQKIGMMQELLTGRTRLSVQGEGEA